MKRRERIEQLLELWHKRTGIRLTLDHSNGGYKIENESGSRNISHRGTMQSIIDFLNGMLEAEEMLRVQT